MRSPPTPSCPHPPAHFFVELPLPPSGAAAAAATYMVHVHCSPLPPLLAPTHPYTLNQVATAAFEERWHAAGWGAMRWPTPRLGESYLSVELSPGGFLLLSPDDFCDELPQWPHRSVQGLSPTVLASPCRRRRGRIYQNAVVRMTERLDSLACSAAPAHRGWAAALASHRIRLALAAAVCVAAGWALRRGALGGRCLRPGTAAAARPL